MHTICGSNLSFNQRRSSVEHDACHMDGDISVTVHNLMC